MRVLAPPQLSGRVCTLRRGLLVVFELEGSWKGESGRHRMQAQTKTPLESVLIRSC